MGLKLTLPKDKNHMGAEFVDAYWAIVGLKYDIEAFTFTLTCFPSREARLLTGTSVEEPSIEGYGECEPVYHPELYSWSPWFSIAQVFPEGIPLGRDAQLKQIYTFIKAYTDLPFEDVFESDQTEEEDTSEELTEPIEEPTEETSDEPSEEVVPEETPSEEEPTEEPSEETEVPSEDSDENEEDKFVNSEETETPTNETKQTEEIEPHCFAESEETEDLTEETEQTETEEPQEEEEKTEEETDNA